MFYSQFILAKKGPLGTIWIAAHLERKLRKNQVADTDIGVSVDSILFPEAPIALRLSSHLLLGVVRIYSRKVNYLFDDCSEALLKVKQAFRSTAVDLPPEESTAPYHSITLPETFDLDDFELPDNEIFQGNYVDHHVSTREQITLQDTMDGVVYSTSQFGLDERFGDGDTSQAALDLDEQVFQDKDVIGSDDEEGPGADHNAYMDAATPHNAYMDAATPHNAYLDAATPETKDETVGVSEARPGDFNDEQVEGLGMRNEFNEDAQAPQTPGLVEVPNSSSVREQLACDDHMEVEDLNAEEVRKTSGGLDANAGESAVTPMEVDKSQIDENVNAQNKPDEERAEHVHVTSPCYSHITTEMEDPGQVMPMAGTNVNNNAVPPLESLGRPTMSCTEQCLSQEPKDPVEEKRDHFAIATEANQETSYGLQGDAQAYSRPDEQLNNAHGTEEQLRILSGFADSDLPPPQQLNHATGELLGNFTGFAKSDLPAPNAQATVEQLGNLTGFTDSVLPTPEQLNNAHATEELLGNLTGFADSVPPAPEQLNNAHATEELLGNFTGFADSVSPAPEQLNSAHATVQQFENFTGFDKSVSLTPEQLNNVHANVQQFGNLTGFTDSALPAPEKILAAPNRLGGGNNFMVEFTPDKEAPGTCNGSAGNDYITGKKRTFTESTLTAESLNSVESVGLFQFKRTVDSVPNDDDLLSSILGGKSSFLKMRPTPVLEATTTKRIRSAPRSTATKRKVQMDDPMVLHGDIIRQQLTNTEGIRRVRKKAPCTIPEILRLQRKAMGNGLLKEPIFTGMSVEITSLHNEPYDLRGIMIIENVDRRASVGVVGNNNECSISAVEESYVPQALPNVEENKTEESYVPQASQNDFVEQPAEDHAYPQDQQIIHQQEETKYDSEVADLEVLKEGNNRAGDDEVNLVPSEEISQMPSEDKLDGVENSQVEGFHENHDGGGLWGQDGICADLNEKSCTEVIEIAEGDIDINAVFNETDLKVEDEIPREDKSTDASAEAGEIGIDEQTPCDNAIETGCTEEAVDLSIPGLENCNEPLVEANNNDEVNAEIEAYNKYDEHNEMSNETAYMQSALFGEPTTDDGLMQDDEEMDTMEVEHDTGFLNVDDDEVDEDHEDDDTEYGEDTRLLENTGWSSRTRAVAKYLQTLFGKEAESGKNVLVADKLLTGKTRKEASRLFFETLVLKTRDYVQVEQAKPYDNIVIKPRPKLTKSIF